MKTSKIALAILLIGVLVLTFAGCSSQAQETGPSESQVATIHRGNLEIAITAVGNLEFSLTEDLAIDLFYPTGTKGAVGEVLVGEGDTVKEGQVLVTLDKDEWDKEVSTLEDAVTSAERQLTTKRLALIQAEINEKNAETALEDAEAEYIWPESVFSARQAVWNAEAALKDAQQTLNGELYVYDRTIGQYVLREIKTAADIAYWTQKVADAEETLRAARVSLDNLLAQVAGDTEEVTIKRLQLELAEGNLADAQEAIEVAQKAVENTREDLAEARSKSPIVTAPFDGFITLVNVEGGDEVLNGTVAVQIADPSKFEAEVMVGETDIMQVNIGGTASVQVDAIPGLSLPAEVTHISPTATIQSGVVNYTVKVEIKSMEALQQERQEIMQETKEQIAQGELPERIKQAITEGRMTQEQAEAMAGQFQQGQEGQQRQLPAATPKNFELREGLTVTVNIIVDEAVDVLMVPNSAITRQGTQSYVQVMSPDGITEQRAIQTGISDYQFTEVTEGLIEGEQIIVPAGAATAPTTQGQNPQSRMFIPGMGRIR
ncbi:efflux RND transporter periplasmic adaptor subunit [Chloroflexota bacterium]